MKETNEEKKGGKKLVGIAMVIIIIAILVFIGVICYLDSIKVKTRLQPEPSNFYSKSSNYVIYNNKIYYYSIDTQDRGRIYKMNFDGSDNELMSSSKELKTPEMIYAYEGNIYCTSQNGANQEDKIIEKISLDDGKIDTLKETELPLKDDETKDLEAKYKSVGNEHSKEEPSETYIVKDKVVFDFDCNAVTLEATNKIAVYDTKTNEYKEYEGLRHFDIDRENNCIYTVDNDYKVNTIKL